jgi:hypothetical protein
MPPLTVQALRDAAYAFAAEVSGQPEPTLFGVTDGKAVGTHLELKFREYLTRRFDLVGGNAVDVKTTSVRQPQSSCPFASARQKVYGLGYDLLLFVYEKRDDRDLHAAVLSIRHVVFVEDSCTADFTTTRRLLEMVADDANEEDVAAYLLDRNLPLDDTGAAVLAREILAKPPSQGYLTISNAQQWRLQYGRAIQSAGTVPGLHKVR